MPTSPPKKPVPAADIIREDSGPSVTEVPVPKSDTPRGIHKVPKKAPNEDNTVNRIKVRDQVSDDLEKESQANEAQT